MVKEIDKIPKRYPKKKPSKNKDIEEVMNQSNKTLSKDNVDASKNSGEINVSRISGKMNASKKSISNKSGKKYIGESKNTFDDKVTVKKVTGKKTKKGKLLINTNMEPGQRKPPIDKSIEQKKNAQKEKNWNGRINTNIHSTGEKNIKKHEINDVYIIN